jgi:hypothetical protein
MGARMSKSANAMASSLAPASFGASPRRSLRTANPLSTSRGRDLGPTPLDSTQQSHLLAGFPHAQTLERAFHHNIPGHAVVDGEGCARRAVPAFTDRTTAHFASPNPPLRVAAHEAVHVLQHAGLSRDAHLGAERHAEAVSQGILKRASVAHLLRSTGAAVEPAVRLYTVRRALTGKPLRVADDGKMAVRQDTSIGSKSFWATQDLISSSNAALRSKNSAIELNYHGPALEGRARDGTRHQLARVLPKNLINGTEGEDMAIWADCGEACRTVMGAGRTSLERQYGTGETRAQYRVPTMEGAPGVLARTGEALFPQELKEQILTQALPGGVEQYESMPRAARRRIDRPWGIGPYAEPAVGQGYAISRGQRQPALTRLLGVKPWNFHWAGVVMVSGSDRVTLENYSVGDPSVVNSNWKFQMYGPAGRLPVQTFPEQREASGLFARGPVTMTVVEPLPRVP